jgi:2-polyprenyl-3-methyl-5-hydroxy-6-metoxy-1,4-benzoquinol methylase
MTNPAPDEPGGPEHWDQRYRAIGAGNVSWYEAYPQASMRYIGALGIDKQAPVVDVGGGASTLVDALAADGFSDITVVDISRRALDEAAARLAGVAVCWVCADVRRWDPPRTYALWHDRAAYHFLTEPGDQQRYWRIAAEHVVPGGHVILATFADDGPRMCSGLPVQRYGPRELADAMGAEFGVLETHRQEHITPTGGTQQFTWVVAVRK